MSRKTKYLMQDAKQFLAGKKDLWWMYKDYWQDGYFNLAMSMAEKLRRRGEKRGKIVWKRTYKDNYVVGERRHWDMDRTYTKFKGLKILARTCVTKWDYYNREIRQEVQEECNLFVRI